MIDLIDSMRTCAAHILATMPDEIDVKVRVSRHAADLLIEASNVLSLLPVGEPMEIIPPQLNTPPQLPANPVPQWTAGDLPPFERTSLQPRSPRSCPQCGSFTPKKVTRDGTRLMLGCPVCGHTWPYSAGAVA